MGVFMLSVSFILYIFIIINKIRGVTESNSTVRYCTIPPNGTVRDAYRHVRLSCSLVTPLILTPPTRYASEVRHEGTPTPHATQLCDEGYPAGGGLRDEPISYPTPLLVAVFVLDLQTCLCLTNRGPTDVLLIGSCLD
jgi:hypothetical protein